MEHISDPSRAMAMEAQWFRQGAERGRLAVWTTAPCVVVPRALTRRPRFDQARMDLDERGFPVVARASGGGVVPQGPGIVNLTVVLPADGHDRSPTADYEWLCGSLSGFLGRHGISAGWGAVPGAFCDGPHNVVVKARKLAGTAQRRGPSSILLHAVVLVAPELEPALEAIRAMRSYLGDPTPLRDEAHVSIATLSHRWSGVRDFAQAIEVSLSQDLFRVPARAAGGP